MSAKRVLLLIFGVLFILGSLTALIAGSALIWASRYHRDAEGFHVTDPIAVISDSYAVVSDTIEVERGASVALRWLGLDTIKVEARSEDPSLPLFIGIAESDEVEDYLSGVEHDEVTDVDLFGSTFEYRRITGRDEPEPPGSLDIWLESSEGAGTRRLEFELEEGEYIVLAMNADASGGLDMEFTFGIKSSVLVLVIGIGFLLLGLAALAGGIVMVVFGARTPRATYPPPPPAP